MDKERLSALVAKGKLEEAIDLLLEISNHFLLTFHKEITLLASRYNAVKLDKIKGVISGKEYSIEANSITSSMLEIILLIDELDTSKIRKKSESTLAEEIQKLSLEFGEASQIKATASRLRMKNTLARKIGEKLIQSPGMIRAFLPAQSDGIICGISAKIQAVPEFGDLDFLESAMQNTPSSNFTRGCITNAVAELVYSQKLQIGDDDRIRTILQALREGADIPLSKNIDRVEAALDYLVAGK